jgi:hypothetical protein
MPAHSARPLRASEILVTPTDHGIAIPKLIGWPQALTWPPDAGELLTPAATKALHTFMWPVTVDEFLTHSPTTLLEMADQERKKPSLDKLLAWLETRALDAYREAPDLDTRRQLFQEAWHDIERVWAAAYEMRRRAQAAQGKILGGNSVQEKQESRGRRRTVIAKSLSRYAGLSASVAAKAFVEQYPELKIDTLRKDINWIRRNKK